MEKPIARAVQAKTGSPFLTTAQAAFYIGLSLRTLETMRWHGLGPTYRKHGRFVRYHINDLEYWSKVHSFVTAKGAKRTRTGRDTK